MDPPAGRHQLVFSALLKIFAAFVRLKLRFQNLRHMGVYERKKGTLIYRTLNSRILSYKHWKLP